MANKKKKKAANPVREWISDNLRYMLLILIVLIAALAVFLIYREVSERRQVGSGTVVTDSSSTSASAASVSSSSGEKEQEKTEVVTATPTPTPTPTPTATPMPDVSLTEMNPAATESVQNYFYSLQATGENENVEYYDSIHVQTCPGPTEGTYIAYADYEYKYWNYDALIPALTEMYLAPDANGTLQEVSNVPEDVQAYITNVRQTESVQNLIQEVTARYQAVMDANPDLNEYINGL